MDPGKRKVEGFDLIDGVYQPRTPTTQGRVWCRQFDAWLGFWKGPWQEKENHWCRLFDRAGNPLPTLAEAERQRADAERQRADAERQRADAAEVELARLRARLEEGTRE